MFCAAIILQLSLAVEFDACISLGMLTPGGGKSTQSCATTSSVLAEENLSSNFTSDAINYVLVGVEQELYMSVEYSLDDYVRCIVREEVSKLERHSVHELSNEVSYLRFCFLHELNSSISM